MEPEPILEPTAEAIPNAVPATNYSSARPWVTYLERFL